MFGQLLFSTDICTDGVVLLRSYRVPIIHIRQPPPNVQSGSSFSSTHLQRRDLSLYSLRIFLILRCSRSLLSPSQLLALESFCNFESVAQLDRGLVKLEL